MLKEHPEVVGINEPLIGLYLGPFLSDLPGFDARALTADDFTVRRIQSNKRDQFFSQGFERDWLPPLRQLITRRFAAHLLTYPAAVPRRRTVISVKEPNGSQSADLLTAALPRSRFLFLLRDGRDVVDSELAANRGGTWLSRSFPGAVGVAPSAELDFVVQSAHKWLWRTEVVERSFEAHRGPKRLLRYEDLLRNPARELREVIDWLGLDPAEEVVRAAVTRHGLEQVAAEDRGAKEFVRAATPGLWRKNLTPDQQIAVENVLGGKLRALGYGDA